MTEEPRPPSGFFVLSSDVRVGTGSVSGIGISSLPPEARERFMPLLAAMELERAIAGTRLVRVIGTRNAVTAHGVSVELLAIEEREGGSRGILRCHARRGLGMGSGHSVFLAAIEIDDDRGTSYEVQSGLWHFNGVSAQADFFFRPQLPGDADEVRVSIARLVPWQPPDPPIRSRRSSSAAIEGPWVFRVII